MDHRRGGAPGVFHDPRLRRRRDGAAARRGIPARAGARRDLGLPYSAWIVFTVVAAAGLCMALHSARFDAAKARFRMGLGQNVCALESPDALVAELQAAKTWRERFVLRLYIPYVSLQRGVGAGAGAIGQSEFLAWCVLGPTMRMSIIVLALVGSLWDAWSLFVYPAFGIVVSNVWLAGLTLTSRRS
jgi:hypothetical protein